MNTVTFSGRTASYRMATEGEKNTEVAYVSLAIAGRDDDFIELKFRGKALELAKKSILIDSPKKLANDKIKNKIYSRTISVSGYLSQWYGTQDQSCDFEITSGLLKQLYPHLSDEVLESMENKAIELDFPARVENTVVEVRALSLLDKMPDFLKDKKSNTSSSAKVKTSAKVKVSVSGAKSGTVVNGEEVPSDMPV